MENNPSPFSEEALRKALLREDLEKTKKPDRDLPLKGILFGRVQRQLEILDRQTPQSVVETEKTMQGLEGMLLPGSSRELAASAMAGKPVPPGMRIASVFEPKVSPEKFAGRANVNLLIVADPIISANPIFTQRALDLIAVAQNLAQVSTLNRLNQHLRFSDVDLNMYVISKNVRGTAGYRVKEKNGKVVVLSEFSSREEENETEAESFSDAYLKILHGLIKEDLPVSENDFITDALFKEFNNMTKEQKGFKTTLLGVNKEANGPIGDITIGEHFKENTQVVRLYVNDKDWPCVANLSQDS